MIKHLYIKDFVLIEELNLDLNTGFSVFTGETGAGKSILVDAISVLCSERASSSLIAKGKEKALIEGTFDLSKNEKALAVLRDAGFEGDEDVTFTREIRADGKSNSRIDHRIVTLSLLKECLDCEIDIHSQRDSQYLLNSSTHIDLLDQYLQDEKLLTEVKAAYQNYSHVQTEREEALKTQYNEDDLEFIQYQIHEIEDAKLQPGEDQELEEKEKKYQAVKSSFEKLNGILGIYDETLSGSFFELNKNLQPLARNKDLETICQNVNDSYFALSDAMEQLKAYVDGFEMSEDDINAMEERLYEIQKLKHKYGGSIDAILNRRNELEQQAERITHRREYLESMNQKVEQALTEYSRKAASLSAVRKKGSPSLDRQIAKNLKELVLPNAVFVTQISADQPSAKGSDKVEFLISMNPGEEVRPLAKVASGGELSRLMLGLKEIFTKLRGIETVIFDEIDSGVSGAVASAIGFKMKSLAGSCQVFSVTHLAPVAACADQHYLVLKNVAGGRTHTDVRLLNENETVDQLALIAAGTLTEASRNAALELYRRSQGRQ
jgi:DNA repair protein RecN (Recombination protein N)